MENEEGRMVQHEKKYPVIFESRRGLTPESFKDLPRDFNFMMTISSQKGKTGINAGFSFVDGNAVARLKLPGEDEMVYPKGKVVRIKDERSIYTIDGLVQRSLDIKNQVELNTDEVVELINGRDGSELIFYTGAGISMGGKEPVWNMNQVTEALGLNNDASLFVQYFQNYPNKLIERIEVFGQQLFADTSTSAHEAIAKIVDKKPSCLVMTENIDLKHEAEGSRIMVLHTGSESTFTVVKQRTKKTKLLITAGLSHDDRAIIEYLKIHNPDVQILCFAKDKDSIPNYLDERDMVVTGDVQTVLPDVASKLK